VIAPEFLRTAADLGLTELARGNGYCVALWRNLYILDFPELPTIEALDAAVAGKKAASRMAKGDLVVINVLSGKRLLPDARVREHAAKKQNEDAEGVVGHAVVVDGEGFWAGAMRSTLAGLYLVSRSPFPRRVFSTNIEALEWHAELLNEDRAWVSGALAAVSLVRAPHSS
jgi:hypothetical protein